ncbi:hypothetical protein FQ186_04995 [Pseudomonas sp. ANT_H14]|nr:hypothetical protein FQ182_10510 [Pseudomonas sp. ANT_H4]KAA0953897.1 hypothetical protein FQ186_04995 [Pseudomonas sp. ANT_H14]
MLAMVVNDDADILNHRGALRFFASKLAPERRMVLSRHDRSNGYVLNHKYLSPIRTSPRMQPLFL